MHRKTRLIPILSPDVTVLRELKKNLANKSILIFTLKPSVCSSRVTFIVKKWTNQVLLHLAYIVQIRAKVFLLVDIPENFIFCSEALGDGGINLWFC